MKRAWTKGWIAAAIALAAILILAIDVAQKQSRPVAHTRDENSRGSSGRRGVGMR